MGKYKRTKIWIILIITLFFLTLLVTAIFKGAEWVGGFFIALLILLIFFCPILIVDVKHASEPKKEKKEDAKKLELKRAEIELEREKLEVEKLKLQKGIVEDSGNYCKFCGASIEGEPTICPKCGSPLSE